MTDKTPIQRISSHSAFEQQMAYCRVVADGHYVHVSGTTGFDYQSMTISNDVAEQTEQCLLNIKNALDTAGATLADVVRVNYILPNREDFEQCWPILKRYLGENPPAATMIVAGLFDVRMKIEIEVTAVIG